MKEYIKKLKGHLSFTDEANKEYNRDFIAYLTDSAAFSYGNKTCVIVQWGEMQNGATPQPELLDTRYDIDLKRDGSNFKDWLTKWFKNNYESHTIKFNR